MGILAISHSRDNHLGGNLGGKSPNVSVFS